MIQLVLTCAAVIFGATKIAATFWLARQPDATLVTVTPLGRSIYLVSKITPSLFKVPSASVSRSRGVHSRTPRTRRRGARSARALP